MNLKRYTISTAILLASSCAAFASESDSTRTSNPVFTSLQSAKKTPSIWQPFTSSFNIQSDMLLSTEKETKAKWFGNSYVSAIIKNNFIEAGARFEELGSPLPGHEATAGRGLPNMYLTGRFNNVELTLGDFYDQFGSGMIFRTYEERTLGIDNSVRGARVQISPFKGLTFKALAGQQRNYFDRTLKVFNKDRGSLYGSDLELNIDQWVRSMDQSGTRLMLGASFVTKHEQDEDIYVGVGEDRKRLNLPLNIPIMGARLNFQKGGFSLYGEYGYKYNDPSADNGYIYHDGQAALLSASYSMKGMSMLLQAKRSENFSFRSQRGAQQTALFINHLPAFTQAHTYSLAAIYPYATQPLGEWAFQGEFAYQFKRNTALGGRYGTHIKLNASHVRGLDQKWFSEDPELLMGTDGYTSTFFGMGDLYYSDINLEISKKLTPTYSFSFSYLNQISNNKILQSSASHKPENIYAHVFIYDGKHRLSPKVTLRTELQYLHTKQDQGDWIYGLAELSLLPSFMFTVSEQYNIGETKEHYYMGSVAYTRGSHRFSLAYGKTRAGMNCSGGVCRLIPETQGFYFSYNANI